MRNHNPSAAACPRRPAPAVLPLLVATLTAAGLALPGQTPPALYLSPQAAHVLRRTSFGPTLALLANVSANGVASYLSDQLNLVGAEDPRVANLLAPITPPADIDHVRKHQVVRAAFSAFQLREVMTQFWDRHFNTFYSRNVQIVQSFGGTAADAAVMEAEENEKFRLHALGNFHELLKASADSRAMILFLSTFASMAPIPNEDYARELLELHTVGPEDASGQPNYTHDDIEAVAKCFTGWNVYRANVPVNPPPPLLARVFVPAWHVAGSKTIFGSPLPPLLVPDRGQTDAAEQDGYDVLWHLANLDATKEFICRKLMAFFLADGASEPALLAACKNAWGSAGGDIKAVLGTILNSPQFLGTTYRMRRLEQPMDVLVGTVRGLDGNATNANDFDGVLATMSSMGQDLFGHPAPDGFANESVEQPGTQIYIDAVGYVQGIFRKYPAYSGTINYALAAATVSDVPVLVSGGNPNDPAHVAEYFLRRLYVDQWTTDDRTRLTEFVAEPINGGGSALLDHANNPTDYANRINLLAVLVATIPQGWKK